MVDSQVAAGLDPPSGLVTKVDTHQRRWARSSHTPSHTDSPTMQNVPGCVLDSFEKVGPCGSVLTPLTLSLLSP